MKISKKILTIGLLSLSIVPFAMVSCNSGEKVTTYFEAEGLKISSKGEIMGFANVGLMPERAINIKESYNGVTITKISNDAFKGQININEVILPSTLVSIGSNAFFDIASPVKSEGQNNFDKVVWDLSHLVNLKEIGDNAFGKKLPTVPGPTPLSINLKLDNLTNLERIGISSFSNRNIYKVDFPLTSKIKVIDQNAFENNELTSLILPNSITSIGSRAFQNNQITSLILSNSVKDIGGEAFKNNKLTWVIIPNLVTYIGWNAFSNNVINNIKIPDSVTFIGNGAFTGNNFTDNTKINLPAKFNTAGERQRIGITLPIKENELNNKPKLEAPLETSRRKNETIINK
ncbi:MAG: leucine-rich repeat domain-containing protein [Metamycoplasmataceae bacterium]